MLCSENVGDLRRGLGCASLPALGSAEVYKSRCVSLAIQSRTRHFNPTESKTRDKGPMSLLESAFVNGRVDVARL
jgi:hypothetical protein